MLSRQKNWKKGEKDGEPRINKFISFNHHHSKLIAKIDKINIVIYLRWNCLFFNVMYSSSDVLSGTHKKYLHQRIFSVKLWSFHWTLNLSWIQIGEMKHVQNWKYNKNFLEHWSIDTIGVRFKWNKDSIYIFTNTIVKLHFDCFSDYNWSE